MGYVAHVVSTDVEYFCGARSELTRKRGDIVARSPANGVHRKGSFKPGYGFVECELAPAPSSEETLVSVERLGGGRAVALVGNADTRPSGPVTSRKEGQVIVTVLERIGGGFVVELPSEAINSTGRVPVPEKSVKFP